jgi:hypothetical protein
MKWLTRYWKQRPKLTKRLGWHPDLQYYIYRSNSKIDMLWEQIDARFDGKMSGELKIKLGIVEAGGKFESKQSNIQDKLGIVLRYLEINEQIGDVGSNKSVRSWCPANDMARGQFL